MFWSRKFLIFCISDLLERVTEMVKDIRFSSDIKEMTCGSSRVKGQLNNRWNFQGVHEKLEFPLVLVFDLWNFHQQDGKVFTLSGKSGKVRKFVRGLGKVRLIRDFLEKVRENSKENFYSCKFLVSIKKSYARRNVCSWIIYDNPLYIYNIIIYTIYDAIICI